jgi:TPP-dependent pyruvate/acetoin dehydrogenase alpha subunit
VVFGSYRSHAYYLAKGGDLNAMMAELYGKQTGCAKGKGGSMHLVDVAHGVMGASAVVGTPLPNAVGYAYALKVQRRPGIVVCFFGDGATEEGVYHESLNFAALKAVPIIFICENNGYAIHTHVASRQKAFDRLAERARGYGLPAECLEDDVFKIYECVKEAAEALRAGKPGPFYFECQTYRWKEHVGPNEDYQLGYRTRDEAEPWMTNDPVKRMAALLDPAERQRIEAEVEAEIQAAFDFAESSPFPPAAELYTNVFKEA